MAWAKIDDQYFFHPKVIAAGRDARDLHLASIVYCSGQLTNGSVGIETLSLLGAMAGIPEPAASAQRLVEVGLWDEVDGGGWSLHDYLEYNPSREQVQEVRKARIEAGRRGGLAKAVAVAKQTPSNDLANEVANEVAKKKQKSTPSPSPSPSPSPNPVPEEEIAAATPPPKPPKRAVKRKRKTDLRTNHPAIQAVREVTNRYPPKPIWDEIMKVLGNEPRIEELQLCFKEWVKLGFNPTNFAWLFDWYVSGIPPRGSGRQSQVEQQTAEAIRQFDEDGEHG